jgi:hypothetical protein
MTFSQAVFLSLPYQESELYTADYWTSDAILILLGLAALAAIPFIVFSGGFGDETGRGRKVSM